MANCRYYAVAGGDIWAMRYALAELAQWTNRSRMIAFVNGAVQELCTRGEGRPCMRARSRRLRFKLRSTEIDRVSRGSAPPAQPTVEAETPRGPYKQNDESAHD